ncbi:hypothetical protein N7539_009300 [Penicillium diatomitis]|uniref:Zn(2)-C6 fungal-type domain-containing protein n=1 Tax=Penicillium diatomitis TaxID=2819901 RepID=A0A9W9WM17_9EURO|nr:uncharacterized protein N7539_009300 [Penicillium diatomitis]KAJ5469682.1 hypothetical protein N7539_009300 [Penicillium diatomitis]
MASIPVAGGSLKKAEKSASSPVAPTAHAAAVQENERSVKLRSCIVCRSRKVRCDKQSPCSNCRRANIACTVPSKDRPPRWARRLVQPGSIDVMERIQSLEALVKRLRNQLDEAHAQINNSNSASPSVHSLDGPILGRVGSPPSHSESAPLQIGRLVLEDANQSRYLGSGFWASITDELNDLRTVTEGVSFDEGESSDDDFESPTKQLSTAESERPPEDRNAFVFRRTSIPHSPDLRDLHPLPSQIPFLINVFSENVNFLLQTVHEPTLSRMIRDLRGNLASLDPATEALMFSIYYGAVTSMEEDDVLVNFGSSKAELNIKYRLGLENALAKADFLSAPNLLLVQALVNFLALARRHDSPRYVWMMVGLAIRMAMSLGLHRDGTNFPGLSPFEIEMRRRVWWALCMLDVRASEDQGTEFTIAVDSFDTKLPENINNQDIQPDSPETPVERDGLTDMSIFRIFIKMTELMKRMVVGESTALSFETKDNMLQEMYQIVDEGFLRHSAKSDIQHWTVVIVSRLTIAKMTLFIYLPSLFSRSRDNLSALVRTKLLVAAIEVAEYNHALNHEQACRQWRWIFQTYTHWHAIVYMLLEASRRPWCPLVERAWTALHSIWLIPQQSNLRKNMRVWFPLRSLMQHTQRHREAEIQRLRSDPLATERLEREYEAAPIPSSDAIFSQSSSNFVDPSLEHWRYIMYSSEIDISYSSVNPGSTAADHVEIKPLSVPTEEWPNPIHLATPYAHLSLPGHPEQSPLNTADPFDLRIFESPATGALSDSIDFDVNIDWHSWVQSAQGVELDSHQKPTEG